MSTKVNNRKSQRKKVESAVKEHNPSFTEDNGEDPFVYHESFLEEYGDDMEPLEEDKDLKALENLEVPDYFLLKAAHDIEKIEKIISDDNKAKGLFNGFLSTKAEDDTPKRKTTQKENHNSNNSDVFLQKIFSELFDDDYIKEQFKIFIKNIILKD
jgi:hypothetical protein